jgi:putative DNA primase/helicase
LLATWDRGGFHLEVFFDRDVPSEKLHAFGKWLVRDAVGDPWGFAKGIETFPKQPMVPADQYASWLRLVGRHHTHPVFASVFDGRQWVEGEAAVDLILSLAGDDPGLIPDEVVPSPSTSTRSSSSRQPDQANRPDVFAEFNRRTSLEDVVGWHQREGHTVAGCKPGRVEFLRDGKKGSGQSFNVEVRDQVPVTYNFSTNAGLPDHDGLSPSEVRCFYENGGCDTAAMDRFADVLRAELGWEPRTRSPGRSVAGEVDYPPPIRGETWNDPHRLARLFAAEHRIAEGHQTLIQWRDEFHRWGGSAWEPIPESELDAQVAHFCRGVFEADYPKRVAEVERVADGKWKPPKIFPVTGQVKSNVRLNLSGLVNHPDAGLDPPFWLDSRKDRDPREIIVAPNGLFTLEDIAAGRRPFASPTPLLFTPNAIPFPVHQSAPPPATWLRCLDEWFQGDTASIQGLQEWFAYLLSGRTKLQKVLLIVGPPRSGKGTILRILTDLLGTASVASTTFTALADNFGLESLLGKRVAIIPDARLSGRTDVVAAIERLLSISGEDLQSVNRKNRQRVTARLRVRFVLASNEIPRLPDASGAIGSRFHILNTPNTWLDREDRDLVEKLATEMPGILIWAAKGWSRLVRQGMRFTQNEAASDYRRELEDLSSPIKAFVRECCNIGSGYEVEIPVLYHAWAAWNEERKREVGPENFFGRELRAAAPHVRSRQTRDPHGKRIRVYDGIGLKERKDWGTDDEARLPGTHWHAFQSNSREEKTEEDERQGIDVGQVSPERVPVRATPPEHEDPEIVAEREAISQFGGG